MKKVKLMLASIAILAVVGGALAFKAKGTTVYCADLNHFGAKAGTQFCPAIPNSTFVEGTPAISYCSDKFGLNDLSTCTIPITLTVRQD